MLDRHFGQSTALAAGIALASIGTDVYAASAGAVAEEGAPSVSAEVARALSDFGRSPWDLERDKYSNPGSVLTFAGLKSGMAVAELMPDGGYYTRILSHTVGEKGHVYTLVPFTAI